jgi:hypothetical protein
LPMHWSLKLDSTRPIETCTWIVGDSKASWSCVNAYGRCGEAENKFESA